MGSGYCVGEMDGEEREGVGEFQHHTRVYGEK